VKRGTACVTLRESAAYCPDVFREGFRRLGYNVTNHAGSFGPDDVLLVWNRRPSEEHMIRAAEARGARVLVAENGYIGKDADGHKLFALALGHHSGAGDWVSGDYNRWTPLGIELRPWRDDGDHILVLGQRSIGEKGVAMPEGWAERTVEELRRRTRREVRLRRHPGISRTDPYDDLRGAWAAVTWNSGAAIKALVAGFPVFHAAPRWVGASAASPHLDQLEEPWTGDRIPMLRCLAWAQWARSEIASGEALWWLLGGARP
jgi:hypothetical protein